MNKPATKEPSMDEILSSIRQIIADDDASIAPQRPEAATPPGQTARPTTSPVSAGPEPLALSAAQIVRNPPSRQAEAASSPSFSSMQSPIEKPEPEVSEPIAEMLADAPELVDPDDIGFEGEPDAPPPRASAPAPVATPPQPALMRTVEPRPAPRLMASVAQAAPMPDPHLSSDIADELLEPATDMAVAGAMSRLTALSSNGIGGMTVEAMIREMLKPMLKDWLDENLPSLVESLVEREIARISRGMK